MVQGLFTTEGYIVIAYIIAIFFIGIWGATKTHSFEDYWSTSGNLGMIFLAGTVLATQWGGVTLLGIAGFGYEHLWMGVWYSLGAVIRFMFWALLLAVVLRKIAAFSISEWFGLRFDNKNAIVMTVLNLIVSLGLLGAQFVAFGTVVTVFFDVPFTQSIIVGAILVTVYTILGGMWGIAYTDVVQVILSGGAAVAMVVYLAATQGGFQAMRATTNTFPEGYFDPHTIAPLGDLTMGWLFFVTLIFLWIADMFLNHNMQRMVSAKNLKVAYWAPIFGGMSYLLIAYVSPALGAYARVVFSEPLENPDFAFPMLAMELLPAYLAGLVAAALLAVVMSSGDGYLLGPSTLAANDLYRAFRPEASEQQVLRVARIITLGYATVALLSALYFETIIALILAYLTIGWAVIPALWASVAWRRATPNAVFGSMVIGGAINGFLMISLEFGLVTTINDLFPAMPPYYVGWIGFVVSVLVLVGGSLLEGKSKVPANIRQPTVATDGGVDVEEDEDLAERADAALKQIHY